MSTGNGGPTGGGGVQTKKGKGKVKVVYDWEGNPTVVREGSGANTGGVVKAKSSNIASNDDSKSSTSTTTSSSTSGGDSSKKPGGTLSYKDSYTDAVASKWESKGGYAAYEKAAKDWNRKKYGTTEPTAKANKFTGGSKTELAKEAKPVKMERREAAPIAINTPTNNRMQQAVASANAPASLLGGTQTRREKRQADRKVNRENREANRIRHAGDKAVKKRANKERRQDARQERGDAKFKKRTGIDMSGTPTYSPQLDTGPGTYQGGPGTYQNPSIPKTKKKKSSGEGWGKSGVIERF